MKQFTQSQHFIVEGNYFYMDVWEKQDIQLELFQLSCKKGSYDKRNKLAPCAFFMSLGKIKAESSKN